MDLYFLDLNLCYFCLMLIVLFYVSDYNWCIILLASLYVWFLSDHDWSVLLVHSHESYILLKLFYSICIIKINSSCLSVMNLLSRYYLSVHNEFLLLFQSVDYKYRRSFLDSFKFNNKQLRYSCISVNLFPENILFLFSVIRG